VTYPSIGNFTSSKKEYTLGVEKAKIGPQGPKTELGTQNQYDREIYPIYKYTFGGQKGDK
jgi:hypothetical protein